MRLLFALALGVLALLLVAFLLLVRPAWAGMAWQALGHDKGTLSTSLTGLEAKGRVTISMFVDPETVSRRDRFSGRPSRRFSSSSGRLAARPRRWI